MFGHQGSSGSISTLTFLATVALGTILAPLDCTIVQAQQLDMNQSLMSADASLFQEP